MAGIFSPQQQQTLNEAADTVGSIIRDRFEAKEAEVFQNNELARFFAESASFNENLPTMETPEALSNSFKQYQNNIFLPFITQTSAKYANNPRIMTVIKDIKERNDKEFDRFMKFAEFGLEQRRTQVEESREGRLAEQQTAEEGRAKELFPLQKQQAEANIEEAKARTSLYRAQAAEKEKETPTTFTGVLQYARNAKDLKNKLEIDKRTENEIVARVISKNRGQLYPSKAGVWSSNPDSEKQNRQEALDYLRQKGILKDVYTAGRVAAQLGPDNAIAEQLLRAGLDPEAVSMVFPQAPILYDDPYKEVKGKIDDKISDQNTVSIITGLPHSTEFNFPDLETYFDQSIARMNNYRDLPRPLQQIFDVIKTDELGNMYVEAGNPETGELRNIPIQKIKSEKEGDITLESALKTASKSMILNDLVQKNTDKYDEVKNFLDKIVDKFLNQVAIEKSPILRAQERLKPEGFGELLRMMGTDFSGLYREGPVGLITKGAKTSAKGLKLLYEKLSGE